MYTKIIKLPFANLKRSNFPEVIDGVLEIVQKHDPATLLVQVMYLKLASFESSLKLFIDYQGRKLPLTEEINELYEKAKNLLYAANYAFKSLKRGSLFDDEEPLSVVYSSLDVSFNDLYNVSKQTLRKIMDDFHRYVENEDFSAAVEKMGLKKYLLEVETVRTEISALELKKVELRAEKKRADLPNLREEIINNYRNLIQAIELAQVEHSDLDYKPLVTELNEFLQPYVIEIKKAKTRNLTNQTDKTTAAASSDKTTATAV